MFRRLFTYKRIIANYNLIDEYFRRDWMDKDIMVYCADCKYLKIINETPYCKFEGICDIYDCEDSKYIKNRPYFKEKHKLIYVSHPYQMKEENKLDAENVVRKLVNDNPNHTYISGLHPFYFMYDEFDYETGINMCLEVLRRCDMMYVYGDWENSRGCKTEIEFCKKHGIPYKIFDDDRH